MRSAWPGMVLLVALTGCATQPPVTDQPRPQAEVVESEGLALADPSAYRALSNTAAGTLSALLAARDERAVVVGETHDHYEDHLVQLAVIRALNEGGSATAVGVEWFPTDAQPTLDAYVAGTIDERTFLARSGYYDRWGFDYRLIRPILRYARDNAIPVVALNAPRGTVRQVSRGGFSALPEAIRAAVPDSSSVPPAYRSRLREVHDAHGGRDFEAFLAVQILWDETMAQQAAEYLKDHPGRRMVVLAGRGHVEPAHSIPERLTRRSGGEALRVLPSTDGVRPGSSGVLHVITESRRLPPSGFLGIAMELTEDGVQVATVQPGSAADRAGIESGMAIERIGATDVGTPGDVQLGLYDLAPGDRVPIVVRTATGERRHLTAELGER